MSETVDSRLKQTEQLLDEYDKAFRLNQVNISPDIDNILNLKEEVISRFSREECYAKAFILAQFSLALQKEINREKAKNKWANHNLIIVLGKEYNNYGSDYVKTDVKIGMLVNGNEYAKSLNRIALESSIRIEEFDYIAARVNTMSNILQDFGRSKRD